MTGTDQAPGRAPAKRWWADLAFAAALVALVWAAYWPSLKHTPRADQWDYLLDTADRHDFLDLVAHTYSYNRTRGIGRGDAALFRPVLFTVLAAEKAFFGPNLWMSQAVGVLLHCGVVFLLLTLLKRVAALARPTAGGPDARPPSIAAALLPYAVVAFFALNAGVMELVIFAHLHGYLVFLVFLLGSLILLLRGAAAPPGRGHAALLGAWTLACLSAFTYEMGQFYGVMAGLFVSATQYRRLGALRALALAAAFAGVLPLYQGVNALDRLAHRGQFTDEEIRDGLLGQALSADTLHNAGRFVAFTTVQPFVPSADKDTYVNGRINVPEWLWSGERAQGWSLALGLLTLLPAAGLGLAGASQLARRPGSVLTATALLLCGLHAAYGAMNVLGRMNLRHWPDILTRNSYYAYPELLLALAAGFTAWAALGRGGRIAAACRWTLLAALAVLAAVNVPQVERVNEMVSQEHMAVRRAVAVVNHFVERHRDEPGFSFVIDYADSVPVFSIRGVPVTTLLFGRWLTAEPKYHLVLRDGEVQARPSRQTCAVENPASGGR